MNHLPDDGIICCVCALCRNVLSSQEVVDFVSERIKPDESGNVRPLSSIVEEVRATGHCTHCHNYYKCVIMYLFKVERAIPGADKTGMLKKGVMI